MNALAHVIVQDIYWGENELHRSNMKKDKATLETFHQASLFKQSAKEYPQVPKNTLNLQAEFFHLKKKYLFLIVYLPRISIRCCRHSLWEFRSLVP